MNKNIFLSTLVSTIAAAVSWILVTLIMGTRLEWDSTLVFVVVFAIVFNITSTLIMRKK